MIKADKKCNQIKFDKIKQLQMIDSFQQHNMTAQISTDSNHKMRGKLKDYNKILAVDDKYNLQRQQISKVRSLLSQEVEYLIQRKQRQKQKKRRLSMMQQEFQRKRKQKLQQLQGKIHQSQRTKSHKIKQKLQRNRRNLQQVSRINRKHLNEYNQTIAKGLQSRRQYYSQQNKNHNTLTSVYSRKNIVCNTNNLLNNSVLMSSRTSNQINAHREGVRLAMESIEEKMGKARRNQEMYKQQIVSKLYERERNHQQIKEKVVSHSFMDEQKVLRQAYGKSQNIVEAGEKVKEMTQKHLNERRRNFQQKLRRIHQNIKYLQSQKQEKFASLQNKFNKIYEPAASSRRRNLTQTNRQRVMLNHLKLQSEKKIKAEEILKKHAQITTKNKIYKEKKDQILQTISKSHSQLE